VPTPGAKVIVWVAPGTPLGAPAAFASRIACRSDPDPESLVLVTTNCARAAVEPRTAATKSAATANDAARTKSRRPSNTTGNALREFPTGTCDVPYSPHSKRPRAANFDRTMENLAVSYDRRPDPAIALIPRSSRMGLISRACALHATIRPGKASEIHSDVAASWHERHMTFTNVRLHKREGSQT
jgi:hypothetical protein